MMIDAASAASGAAAAPRGGDAVIGEWMRIGPTDRVRRWPICGSAGG
jgi:hypothetical protein